MTILIRADMNQILTRLGQWLPQAALLLFALLLALPVLALGAFA